MSTKTEERTMKAVLHRRFGSPDTALQIADIPAPIPEDDQVLVEVEAAGLAIGDWLIMHGMPFIARPSYGIIKPKTPVAGLEMAGRVVEVGERVTEFEPGDAVFGLASGAFAEFATVTADQIAPKPERLSFEEAAALPISALAAFQALHGPGAVRAGQRVLIVGASGAVGTFAVQIAKAAGAEVTGVVSTRNVDMVRSLGADHVVDYTRQGIADGDRRYDLIVDMAGNRSLTELRHALVPGGTLVIVGSSGGKWLMGFGRTIRAMAVNPFVKEQLRPFFSKANKADLLALADLVESGRLTPAVDRTYPLVDTVAAMRYVAERHTRGKTVIVV